MNENIPLGKKVTHSRRYDPGHLFPIPRSKARESLGIGRNLPFFGVDIWNAYEVSWLDPKGKPRVAMGQIRFPADSENIIESKSLKLYLNSFNQTRFDSAEIVASVMESDLCRAAKGRISVSLTPLSGLSRPEFAEPEGICIDDLDIEIDRYRVDSGFLTSGKHRVEEGLYSNLLRTRCPVTGQPDWATIVIHYSGPGIDHAGLLRYIVSFREHADFHENCIERIFFDIWTHCKPENLTVYAGFTRRGGIEINPYRSSRPAAPENRRYVRQ